MAWEVIQREDKFQGSNKPFISIADSHISFNAMFTRQARLETRKFVIIHADSENFKLGFEFCDEEKPNSLKLSKNVGRPGLFCSAKGILPKYPWLNAVTKLDRVQDRRFDPVQEGRLWAIQICPAFELRRDRNSQDIPSGLCGIYRYLRESGQVVYIGRGNIRGRLTCPERKDWDFDTIEYSKISDPDKQVSWEYYWLQKHKEINNGSLPFYNKVSGSDSNEG